MNGATSPCTLRFTADDLSALRDHALSVDDERRITAHVGSCLACQRIIATYDALASALRAEQPPTLPPRVWRQLQAQIVADPTVSAPSHPPRWRSAAFWNSLGAVAAVVILAALFVSLFSQLGAGRRTKPLATATSSATATVAPISTVAPTNPIQGAPLSWRTTIAPVSIPAGNGSSGVVFDVAPSDPATAYICAAQGPSNASGYNVSTHFAIWATHSTAHSWEQVATLASPTPAAFCALTVETNDPLRLNVQIVGDPLSPSHGAVSFLSDDGGRTWRALHASVSLTWLTARSQTSGTSVALAQPADGTQTPRLVVSTDDFATWTPIDSPLIARGLQVSGVWQRPGDGALLVTAESKRPELNSNVGGTIATYSLWQSADMGATWKEIPAPANLTGDPGFVVAQPHNSDPWRICGFTYAKGDPYFGEAIACTQDAGQTWTPRPLTTLRVNCEGSGCTELEAISGAILLDNGTLVASFAVGPTVNGITQFTGTEDVFALPAGASHWQDLGAIPGGVFLAVDTSSSVMLVGYYGNDAGGGTGSMLGYMGDLRGYTGSDYTGALSFARLP
jgi:hypothetical protein